MNCLKDRVALVTGASRGIGRATVAALAEEGVRLTSQVVDCPNERLEIGMPLEVTFERMSDAVAVPKFRPRA